RMERELQYLPPERRDAAFFKRPQYREQVARLRKRSGRGRIHPEELGRVLNTPGRKLERKAREIRRQDFGRRKIGKAAILRCGPEPVTDAGPEPPGPAAPLIGGSA